MSTSWRLLNHTSSELPPLLIFTSFTSNSYIVSITDLAYIWNESLNRRNIIKRSLDEDTSIDPSEDAEQLQVFLDRIYSALLGGENSSLKILAKSSTKSSAPTNLDLFVTVNLPKGLEPLEWPIHLTLLPQSELSSQLTIPILRAQTARMRELDKLFELLRDKDHVIHKLVDKLETTGAELGHVFPGASGKGGRKIPRKLAEERVKGLGVFEAEDWRKEMKEKEKERSCDVKTVVKEAFERVSLSKLDIIVNTETRGSRLNWWDNLKGNPLELSNMANMQTKYDETKTLDTLEKIRSIKEDEDDFQVQATPSNLGASLAKDSDGTSPPTLISERAIEDTTDDDNYDDNDDDDLGASSQRSIDIRSVPLPLLKQPRKLGAIGDLTRAPVPAPKAPIEAKSPISQPKVNEKELLVDDDETASEDEGDQPVTKSLTTPRLVSPPPRSGARIGGLENFGGRTRQSTPPVVKAPGRTTTPDRKPKHQLGVIGRKAATLAPITDTATGADDATSRENESEMRSREVSKEEQKENRRETSQERADRKREELKRTLGEKAKVPIKKKRKF